MLLRPYHEADAARTRDVFLRAIRITASAHYSPEQIAAWAGTDVELGVWDSALRSRNTEVVEIGGEVAGFTDVASDGYVHMMFVDPEYARRGAATMLLRWAAETASAVGADELSTHASITARPFFEAHGFVVESEQHPVVRGVEMTNFVMRKKLERGDAG